MPSLKQPCTDCGAEAEHAYADRVSGTDLVWFYSIRCEACEMVRESDDRGPLPAELRDVELRENGTWCVRVDGPLSAQAALILKELLELSVSQVQELRQNRDGVVFSGTRAEAERLVNALRSEIPGVAVLRSAE
jgi:hypothetical protein